MVYITLHKSKFKISYFLHFGNFHFIFKKLTSPKNILVAPLDWGLGHATRCIPLIKFLTASGHQVIIASSGGQLALLQNEFPGLQTIGLKGYNIQYTGSKRWLPLKILWQSPKIMLSIRRENRWLQHTIKDFKIDLVISDNRFGLWSKQTACVFITHQLNIQAPFAWLEKLIQKINYNYINHYSACWVPDFKESFNIAGILSHPLNMPVIPVNYIGPLCRFEKNITAEKKYSFLILLSGPEPQRTLLENKIFSLVPKLIGKILILRGKPGSEEKINLTPNCTVVNHLNTTQLQQAFAESEYIISRCGYTTIMEVLSLQKKAILIPTPGQTEQEYLAPHLMQQSWCYTCNQNDDLLFHINKAKDFTFNLPAFSKPVFKTVLDDFITKYL